MLHIGRPLFPFVLQQQSRLARLPQLVVLIRQEPLALNSPSARGKGRRGRFAGFLSLLAVIAVAACDREISTDITVVPIEPRQGPPVSFEETAEIRAEFGHLYDIEIDQQGNVFVGDWGATDPGVPVVWVFDGSGRRRARLDAADGLRHAVDLDVYGDTLYALDALTARLQLFSIDPDSIALSRQLHLTDPTRRLHGVLVDADRSIFVWATPRQLNGQRSPADSVTLHRVDRSGAADIGSLSDPVLSFPLSSWLATSIDGGSVVEELPFRTKSLIQLSEDGVIHQMWTGAPELRRYSQDGVLVGAINLTVPVRDVTSRDFSRFHASILGSGASILEELKATRLARAFDDGRLPEVWPFASGLVVDDAGRTWLSVTTRDDQLQYTPFAYLHTGSPRTGREIVILDASGRIRSDGRLPIPGDLASVRGDRAIVAYPSAYRPETLRVLRVEFIQ